MQLRSSLTKMRKRFFLDLTTGPRAGAVPTRTDVSDHAEVEAEVGLYHTRTGVRSIAQN